MNHEALLSLIIFAPTIGALALLLCDKSSTELMRYLSMGVTIVTFFLTLLLARDFDPSIPTMQMNVLIPWIKGWNVNYQLGVDGISLPADAISRRPSVKLVLLAADDRLQRLIDALDWAVAKIQRSLAQPPGTPAS